ncbi:LOW QUALITY PROTEIN: ATPase family AAA domain-containing protein 5-like [Xyrichtys novacula]|uniref:LOW QUALITY PROTEIN: ATPase family AAA domain-containing protein 5-like n=1 Tax=Xyrichtys novacula TaxID=13765 RepID=A0AAV1GTZ4_XYRNO|nr:LOW QUALITY PROTEIN: ATPase family AAA domain-containing protein 5-like [Xyrichtys novacula]
MAGIVAMASVIEDFDTKPCKKSHKNAGSPVVKTITNYFLPVPKPEEKSFSPPRSNNIMDYFNRKAPSPKDENSSPEQSKENCKTSLPAERHTIRESGLKGPPRKQSRKASKAARKLVDPETVSPTSEQSSTVEEEQLGSGDSAAGTTRCCGVLGSDTAAQLVQISAEACWSAGKSKTEATEAASLQRAENDENEQEDGSKRSRNVDMKPEIKCVELSPSVSVREKVKQSRAAVRSSRKRQQHEVTHTELEQKKGSLCDVVDEASPFNSTVTISFQDFVRSREKEDVTGEQDKEDDGNITERDTDPMEILQAEENLVSEEPSLQVSPRTLTVWAEVHAVSPKQDAAKVGGKVASIFQKRKGVTSPVLTPPSQTEVVQNLPNTSPTVKRKSNVVLQEEDLELAVLESELAPKCSDAEKKQFMAAFKQPSLDGSKAKPGKSQIKPKQSEEKVSEQAEKASDEESSEDRPAVIQEEPAASQVSKAAKKKPTRKETVKGRMKKTASAPDVDAPDPDAEPATETVTTSVTSAPSTPTVRRSKREAAIRQTPEVTLTTPLRQSRKHRDQKDTADVLAADSPADVSTPKRRRSRHGVFVAELLCPPDVKQSPIRIKFTRVPKNVSSSAADGSSGSNTPGALKVTVDSQKRKQVRKLVEKAKVIQQSKKTEPTPRRSSRANAKKSYCEDEDSVIIVEEDQTAAPQMTSNKSSKSLRSLNDVLGKASPADKETRATGSKMSPAPEKPARKASAVISIFDDSSQDGSDSTQDGEHFRARREFLKSGLPESLRKQIAKSAASKEAYSLSCSSFQPVIHIKQQTNDCPLWTLSWPGSLGHLKDLWCQTGSTPAPVCGPVCVKTEPSCRVSSGRGSGWRPEISKSVRQLLLEEVRSSNPSFPVQMFIDRFLKRRSDLQQQQQSSAVEPEAETRASCTALLAEQVGGKRKRRDDEGETTAKVAKKQRANSSEEKIPALQPPTERGGRPRRGRRSRQGEEPPEVNSPSDDVVCITPKDDSQAVLHDAPLVEDVKKKDVGKEDVLWTDKYQPQLSSDIVGNSAQVRRLHSWLKEWKLRADREERKKQKEKETEEGDTDSDWDCRDDDSQDGEDMLCNTMLITGPSGVGKTAAVYACAQELGFKVFEVNASSQRSGRLILSQLKEATQSHQVDSQGVNAHKPSYFNSYATSSGAGAMRPGSSPRKVNSPRRVFSSPRKHPQSPRGAKRGGLAPTSLANFFKVGHPTVKDTSNTKKSEQTAVPKKTRKGNDCLSKSKDPETKPPAKTTKDKVSEEHSKKTATSLILFEEVDVIFDEDLGFLSAIKTFMTTTKRPVILTTSDPTFSSIFDGHFEEIIFQTPSEVDVSSFLRLLCLSEDAETNQSDISSLLRVNGCNIRQSLMQLQFWTCSGGGRSASVLTNDGGDAELKPDTESEGTLPRCNSGCTESMLGLLNIEPQRDISELLRVSGSSAVFMVYR